MFIPPPVHETKKCTRCGLLYPKDENECSHCSELTDKEVINLKEDFVEEQKGNSELGKLFLFISSIVALIMIILAF